MKTRIIERTYSDGTKYYVIQKKKVIFGGWKDVGNHEYFYNRYFSLESAKEDVLLWGELSPQDFGDLIKEKVIWSPQEDMNATNRKTKRLPRHLRKYPKIKRSLPDDWAGG